MSRYSIGLLVLGLGLVFAGCPKNDADDDSAVDDDDAGDDDVGDDDVGDDDAADDDSATDDDDSAAGDDDDTSGPHLLDVEVTWVDTEVPGNPDPTVTMEDLGGGDMLVNLDAWHLNCCIDLIVGAALPRDGMCRINLDDIGKPCFCESGMDVDITVHGVPVGPLDVTVIYAGLDIATDTLEMGP